MSLERTSAARASLGSRLDAFDGAQDGGTMDGVNPASLGLRFTVDQHGIGGTGGKCGIGNARYLYGAGKLGGGHLRLADNAREWKTKQEIVAGVMECGNVFHHHLLMPRMTGAGGLGNIHCCCEIGNTLASVVRDKAIEPAAIGVCESVLIGAVVARGSDFGEDSEAHETDFYRFADFPRLLAVADHFVTPQWLFAA